MKKITETLFARSGVPVITAHSGCEGTPDNSIEHIKTAIASGAEMLEIDIREHDGTLYLTHDSAADYAACATLAQCFELVAETDDLCINCDVKTFGLTEKVCRLAAQYGMESRIVFTGSVGAEERKFLAASPADWWLSLWRSPWERKHFAEACAEYASMNDLYRIINLDYKMVNDALLDKTKENGYMLSVWTVNNEKDIRRMMKSGIINITTRQPKLALAIRKELFGE